MSTPEIVNSTNVNYYYMSEDLYQQKLLLGELESGSLYVTNIPQLSGIASVSNLYIGTVKLTDLVVLDDIPAANNNPSIPTSLGVANKIYVKHDDTSGSYTLYLYNTQQSAYIPFASQFITDIQKIITDDIPYVYIKLWDTSTVKLPVLNNDTNKLSGDYLVDTSITTNKLADNAVTGDKIALDTIITNNLSSGCVTNDKIASGIFADKITSNGGTRKIPLDAIPKGAIERLCIVSDDIQRFQLTTDDVQNGDTVKVRYNESGEVVDACYFVVDDTQLDCSAGYEPYSSGRALSVDWSGVENAPEVFTVDDYGFTPASEFATGERYLCDNSSWKKPNIDNLSGINAVNKLSGHSLVYNAETDLWEPQFIAGSSTQDIIFDVTVPTTGWTETSPYTLTITVPSMQDTFAPITSLSIPSVISASDYYRLITAYKCIDRITTQTGAITLYCYTNPPADQFNLRMWELQYTADNTTREVYQVTIPTNWLGDASCYYQTIPVNGLKFTDEPLVDMLVPDGLDTYTFNQLNSAYSCINRVVSSSNNITLYCYNGKPTISFTIILKVI